MIRLRTLAAWALRYSARVAFATWFGGFTFYAAVVVPDLHEALGGMETGEISRRVSVVLNAIGAAALGLAWAIAAVGLRRPFGRKGWGRVGLLATSTACLAALFVMHREMVAWLESGSGLRGFHTFHEAYLIVSTVQWGANLGLLALGEPTQRRPTAGAAESFGP